MALRLFHPCQFYFEQQDIRVVGQTISGGVSMSDIEDVVRTDGGGTWRAVFSQSDIGERSEAGRRETLSWRAVVAGMLGGAVPIIVRFCDTLHQPQPQSALVPHSDGTPFSDTSLYRGSNGRTKVLAVVNGQAGGNRATVIEVGPEVQLLGGEKFTHVHALWGERAYETYSVQQLSDRTRITFQPPIRGGVKVGDTIDFGDVRCRMRLVQVPESPLSQGSFTSIGSVEFREDMAPPVVP